VCQADIIGAGRYEPLIDPVVAEVALAGDVAVMVIGDGIIGAFIHAGLATGAPVVIHDHYAVIALANGLIRANVHAGGIVAMAAQVHLKAECQFVIDPPGAILFNLYQLDALGRPVLLLAGHLARLAAPAQVVIYSYFKFGHDLRLYLLSRICGISEYIKEWILFISRIFRQDLQD
jgi:hypothetical protein